VPEGEGEEEAQRDALRVIDPEPVLVEERHSVGVAALDAAEDGEMVAQGEMADPGEGRAPPAKVPLMACSCVLAPGLVPDSAE